MRAIGSAQIPAMSTPETALGCQPLTHPPLAGPRAACLRFCLVAAVGAWTPPCGWPECAGAGSPARALGHGLCHPPEPQAPEVSPGVLRGTPWSQ